MDASGPDGRDGFEPFFPRVFPPPATRRGPMISAATSALPRQITLLRRCLALRWLRARQSAQASSAQRLKVGWCDVKAASEHDLGEVLIEFGVRAIVDDVDHPRQAATQLRVLTH
jgi:hypothetical protein